MPNIPTVEDVKNGAQKEAKRFIEVHGNQIKNLTIGATVFGASVGLAGGLYYSFFGGNEDKDAQASLQEQEQAASMAYELAVFVFKLFWVPLYTAGYTTYSTVSTGLSYGANTAYYSSLGFAGLDYMAKFALAGIKMALNAAGQKGVAQMLDQEFNKLLQDPQQLKAIKERATKEVKAEVNEKLSSSESTTEEEEETSTKTMSK